MQTVDRGTIGSGTGTPEKVQGREQRGVFLRGRAARVCRKRQCNTQAKNEKNGLYTAEPVQHPEASPDRLHPGMCPDRLHSGGNPDRLHPGMCPDRLKVRPEVQRTILFQI